jgi:hypothetical protein
MKFPPVDLRVYDQLCREMAELGLLEPVADSPKWRVSPRGRHCLSVLLAVEWLDRGRLPQRKSKPKLTLVKG